FGEELVHRLVNLGILRAFHHLDLRLAGFAGERFLQVAEPDDLAVGEAQGLDDLLLRHLLGASLHHDDRLAGTGHHQVELALLHTVDRRVYHQLVLQQPDADRPDRTLERNWRDGQRQRGAIDRQGGWIRFLVHGEDRRHHLDVVAEILGKQRPDRPVDQAAVQNRLLAGPPLTSNEAAGDLAGGVALLFVVARQREKVDALPRG